MNKKPFPELLSGKRIELKKHSIDSAAWMFRCIDQDRKRLGRYFPWVASTRTSTDTENYIRSSHQAWAEGRLLDFSIFERQSGAYLGNIGAHHISWKNQSAELGYWLFSEHEGKGYISEAVQLFENALFDAGFVRVEIRCETGNARSAAVPKRLGYQFEGLVQADADLKFLRDNLVFSKSKVLETNQVDVFSSDLKASIQWYQKALGCNPVIFTDQYAEFVVGSQSVCIHRGAGSPGYWRTDSLPDAIRHFEDMGATVHRGPLEIPGERAVCQIQDPVGNILGVMGRPRISA
ncbi:MAG: GNAT family N-acetyltransferase [Bdellovibrionales bacterium]|nr:GNAT family N-acetyltransferase [Bdellovibrionales bacterium]